MGRRDRRQRGDRRDAAVRKRVACAAPASALLGDAEQGLSLETEPRRDRRDEEGDEQQPPRARTAGRVDHRADRGAADRARHRDCPGAISQQGDNGVHADRPRQVRGHRIARGPDCAGCDGTGQPHHARRTERDRNIVVEANGHGFDQRTDGGRNHRRHEREHQRRARRHRRSRPARQRHTRNRTEHDKGRRPRDCLIAVP